MRGGEPINFAVDFENRKMYLKFVRHSQPSGSYCRGTLYSVHFQPNEKGGYNKCLRFISDAYEMACGDAFPLPLIYPIGVRRANGHLRLALGQGGRYSLLHLINRDARERLMEEVLGALRERQECRVDVAEAQ